MSDDEIWTTRDGRKIPVGEMSEDHVRNALRMILRKRRKLAIDLIAKLEDRYNYDGQDELSAQAYRDLANPAVYFPLLGVHGSPDLQKKHGGNV